MSDDKDNGRAPGGRPPLTLKPRGAGSVSAGTVKQSFSHGRSKTVVVETKRARTHVPAPSNLAGPSSSERRGSDSRPQSRASSDTSGLSAEEVRARQAAIDRAREQALLNAATKARDERERAEQDAAAKAAEAAQAKAAQVASEQAASEQAASAPAKAQEAPAAEAPAPQAPAPAPVAKAEPAPPAAVAAP
ncbi:MAG: translation initiation factor IF-2 associated domain-containing protein, partial [Phenylobacterium sp.]|nr:translation initiation factor IF-2 associated domain-containing protein [Phenylobacterium sp.]